MHWMMDNIRPLATLVIVYGSAWEHGAQSFWVNAASPTVNWKW